MMTIALVFRNTNDNLIDDGVITRRVRKTRKYEEKTKNIAASVLRGICNQYSDDCTAMCRDR